MGARRPRTSLSTHATAPGRDHGTLPSAPSRKQKLGARRPRTSCSTCAQHNSKTTARLLRPSMHGPADRNIKMGARRPRASFKMRATAENQGRDHRTLHRHQVVAKRGARGARTAHAARALQLKTNSAVTAPRHGPQTVSKNGCAGTAHFIQHARYRAKSRARSPHPSIGTKS